MLDKNDGYLRLSDEDEILLQKGVDRIQHPPYMAPHRRGAAGLNDWFRSQRSPTETDNRSPGENRGSIVVRLFC